MKGSHSVYQGTTVQTDSLQVGGGMVFRKMHELGLTDNITENSGLIQELCVACASLSAQPFSVLILNWAQDFLKGCNLVTAAALSWF